VINAHYVEIGIHLPFVAKSKTKTARLLADTKKFELEPDRHEPLSDKTFDKMHDLAHPGPFTGFRSLVWDIAALGCYGGFSQQEYAMDYKNKEKYFVTPAGQVVCAFTMENILFRDKDWMIIRDALLRPDLVEVVGMCYVVQKNRRNGQVIWYSRDMANPSFCPVVCAVILGPSPSDPICVYRDTTDDMVYLTGAAITEYFRYVTSWSNQTLTQLPSPLFPPILCELPHVFFLQKLHQKQHHVPYHLKNVSIRIDNSFKGIPL